jgi:hypothetical protein
LPSESISALLWIEAEFATGEANAMRPSLSPSDASTGKVFGSGALLRLIAVGAGAVAAGFDWPLGRTVGDTRIAGFELAGGAGFSLPLLLFPPMVSCSISNMPLTARAE